MITLLVYQVQVINPMLKVNNFMNNKLKNIEEYNFRMITEQEVLDTLLTIKSKATGSDYISVFIYNLFLPHILPTIVHLINSCIEQSLFPICWKSLLIIPITKVFVPKSYDELRPISILPALSKVTENLLINKSKTFEKK